MFFTPETPKLSRSVKFFHGLKLRFHGEIVERVLEKGLKFETVCTHESQMSAKHFDYSLFVQLANSLHSQSDNE